MVFDLGRATLIVRGLHESPLRGALDRDARLRIIQEDDNPHDQNAVKVVNDNGIIVGRVAWEQARQLRSVLELCHRLQVKINARFIRTKSEIITKRNGS